MIISIKDYGSGYYFCADGKMIPGATFTTINEGREKVRKMHLNRHLGDDERDAALEELECLSATQSAAIRTAG